MKLLFIISDFETALMTHEHLGKPMMVARRAVEIELTADQVEKLSIQKIGVSCGKDVFETIESLSFKLETKP